MIEDPRTVRQTLPVTPVLLLFTLCGSSPPATGIINVNGLVVLRVPPGESPFPTTPFQADISNYSGYFALIEFVPDSRYRGTGSAEWVKPRIVTGNEPGHRLRSDGSG